MQATLNPASNDPHDVLEIAPDIVLVARAEEELSKLARETKARTPQSPQPNKPKPGPSFIEDSSVPPIDTGFRATAVNRGRSSGGVRAIRRFVGLLLAICLGIAVLTLKVSGDVAQQVIAAWVPQFAAKTVSVDSAVPPQEQSAAAAEQSAAAPQAATTTAAAPQASPSDSTVQANAAPAAATTSGAAAPSPDQSQMMRSMAHHLESVGQEIEGLKAQIAELKASQEQMSRDMAKTAEQRDRMKLSALPPRPAAPPPRRPPPVFRPAPTAAAPMPPPPATASVPPQAAAPYSPPAASPYVPPPQAAPQAAYDPNAPRPPLPVRE